MKFEFARQGFHHDMGQIVISNQTRNDYIKKEPNSNINQLRIMHIFQKKKFFPFRNGIVFLKTIMIRKLKEHNIQFFNIKRVCQIKIFSPAL
jgi:hypothetical protein